MNNQSKWNQSRTGRTFARSSCPICGAKLTEPDRSGAFDDTRSCTVDPNHYNNFISLFADSVTILGRRFDCEDQIEEIEAFLDQVGNLKYKS